MDRQPFACPRLSGQIFFIGLSLLVWEFDALAQSPSEARKSIALLAGTLPLILAGRTAAANQSPEFRSAAGLAYFSQSSSGVDRLSAVDHQRMAGNEGRFVGD